MHTLNMKNALVYLMYLWSRTKSIAIFRIIRCGCTVHTYLSTKPLTTIYLFLLRFSNNHNGQCWLKQMVFVVVNNAIGQRFRGVHNLCWHDKIHMINTIRKTTAEKRYFVRIRVRSSHRLMDYVNDVTIWAGHDIFINGIPMTYQSDARPLQQWSLLFVMAQRPTHNYSLIHWYLLRRTHTRTNDQSYVVWQISHFAFSCKRTRVSATMATSCGNWLFLSWSLWPAVVCAR